jgi:hypothetical protein
MGGKATTGRTWPGGSRLLKLTSKDLFQNAGLRLEHLDLRLAAGMEPSRNCITAMQKTCLQRSLKSTSAGNWRATCTEKNPSLAG